MFRVTDVNVQDTDGLQQGMTLLIGFCAHTDLFLSSAIQCVYFYVLLYAMDMLTGVFYNAVFPRLAELRSF